jgi:hypothetical protein
MPTYHHLTLPEPAPDWVEDVLAEAADLGPITKGDRIHGGAMAARVPGFLAAVTPQTRGQSPRSAVNDTPNNTHKPPSQPPNAGLVSC